MNVTFACPHCEKAARAEIEIGAGSFVCPHCDATLAISRGTFAAGRLSHCLVCHSRDIFLRKDFPQRLGVLIVAVGFLASSVTWAYSRPIWTFAILFATALVDVVLYLVMPNAVVCYHCGALYRGLPNGDTYAAFNLETHERHRQQKIRLSQHARLATGRGHTADAGPDSTSRAEGTHTGN